MITKPEDATPRYVGGIVTQGSEWFTAAECADIAKAYLAAYLKEKRALVRPDSEHKKAEANLRAWRAKFKEWQKT